MTVTNSARQTKNFALSLAKKFLADKAKTKNALVFALSGDLGSGKTTFVQGFLKGLGVRKKITSPTFVLIKNYELRIKNYGNRKRAYHIDCYRIKKSKELLSLGLKEILNNPQNIALIEWPENIKRILPKNAIWLKFEHGENFNKRIIQYKTNKLDTLKLL